MRMVSFYAQTCGGRRTSDVLNCRTVRSGDIVHSTRAARKHGISDEQMRDVIEHCGLVFDQPAPVGRVGHDRLVYLGDDAHGVPLEVVAVANAAGDRRVIHAMKLREKYRRECEEAVPWRTHPSS
jgi:hypothetical protein